MKSDFDVMDALIDSVIDDLTEVSDELNRMQLEMRTLRNQHELWKKEYKELQEGEQE